MLKGPIGPRGPNRSQPKESEPLNYDDVFPTAGRRIGPVNYSQHPDYDKLPVAIQAQVSPKDYLWLDDEGKRNLVADFTMPEVGED